MAIRKFRLTETQTAELRQAYERTKDGPTRTHYQAVRLYGSGCPVAQIEEITDCSRTSLLDWCRLYRTHGVPGLLDGRLGGNRAKLTPAQCATVRASLHQYTPRQRFGPEMATADGQCWTVPDLTRAVQAWFGVTGAVPRPIAPSLPLVASPTNVPRRSTRRARSATCWPSRNSSKKLIDIAQDAPEAVILVEDAASLYLQAAVMRVWAPRGQQVVVAADPGRAKTSCSGTLNLHTGAEIVLQAEQMNAQTTAEDLEQLLAAHPDVPLLLVGDRAPWHRGEAIRAVLAANPRREIVPFPVAALELNPQEQVWKATREAVSHNHTDWQLVTLAGRFTAHLRDTPFPTSFLAIVAFTPFIRGLSDFSISRVAGHA